MAIPTSRLLSAEEIAVQAGQQVPFLRLPEGRTVFAERAMRLRQRAAGHAMRDYLLFIAEVAEAQQAVLDGHAPAPLPTPTALAEAARLGAPPLPGELWPRDPLWRAGLRQLLTMLRDRLAATPARERIVALLGADDAWLEGQATRLLGQTTLGLDLASAPLIAAALQVHWTHLVLATAASLMPVPVSLTSASLAVPTGRASGASIRGSPGAGPASAFGRVDDATRCPCCASRPTASITRIGGDDAGYRYLHCALCAAEWHMVRIKCSHCLGTSGIHYRSLQPSGEEGGARQAPVEAETCDSCGHYLKIVHMERDNQVDPVADDLASVTLDLLVADAGFERHGVNLMLLFGDADEAPATRSGG